MRINKHDTQGTKPLLGKGELGYDDYQAGGDTGRVYVGTGTENIPVAKKSEVMAVDSKADAHIARVDNPHGVTKAQVGLGLVDNTADGSKNVLSSTKWTTARTITLSGDVAGSASVDGSANVTITTTVQPNSVALGTDTVGNYMASATAGTGISISGTAGEGWSPTITNTAPNVTTDITTTHNATNVVVNSSDGTDGTINGATQTLAGVMTAVDKVKLDGIATGATANTGTVTSIATSGAITGGTITSTGTISHSTADGYLHVPATGTTNNGKVLMAGATAGSLSWAALPSASVTSVAGKTGAVTLVKGDVGLGSVDNTADSTKNVLSATKFTTARTISLTGDVTGSVSFDGSANVSMTAEVANNSHNHTDLSGTVTFYGSTGNVYHNSNITVNGNGAENTIKPSIGFHQPNLYAGTLAMLDGGTFQFKMQDGITSAILANSISGNAATATKASTLAQGNTGNPMTFNWSGQDGQPSWLWGGNDGTNMYVYNPSNFSVNYANTCWRANDLGNHQWAGYGATGYERRSTGIIEQWGEVYSNFKEGTQIDVYFATTFPSECYNVVLCPIGATSIANDNGSLELIAKYTNRFTVRSNSQANILGVSYTAKGV